MPRGLTLVQKLTWRIGQRTVRRPNGCLEWMGARSRRGYGVMRVKKKSIGAHRVAWVLANGRDLLPGEIVMHSCDSPPCVEPTHLSVGTQQDNLADMVTKGRHRPFGHVPKSVTSS